jgi:hypothetical protein
MKKIIPLIILLNISINGFTQKIILASNPLEEILQKDFDSTILYSYSNRSYRPNYLIITKKDSLVFFYRYSSMDKNFYSRDNAPLNSNIHSKLISNQLEFIETKPSINDYFSWVDTKSSNKSIWKDITKYNIWNLVDGSKLDSLDTNCETEFHMGYEIFKLITKDKIIELKYYNPRGLNEDCKFNQTRDDIIKIEDIIFDYFKLSIKLIQ